jgi:hypothetical protein
VALASTGCGGPSESQPSNLAPSIAPIADQRTTTGEAIEIPMSVDDEQPDTLTFEATSSDPSLVAPENVEVAGSGTDRSLRVAPSAFGIGSTTIGVTARDAEGAEGEASFVLQVDAPFAAGPIRLLASDAAAGDGFGYAVAIDGDVAIVGAPGDDREADNQGAAYVFEVVDGFWTEVQKLVASDAAQDDSFGGAVAVQGDLVLVGAAGLDDGIPNQGGVYVFQRANGTWTEVETLLATGAAQDDFFGGTVALDGDYALIGAPGPVAGTPDGGAAYVFRRGEDGWTQMARLVGSDAAATDRFGFELALGGDVAVVGVAAHNLAGDAEGAAYLFERSGDAWVQTAKLTANDPESFDGFGQSVAVDGDAVVVGVPGDGPGVAFRGSARVFVRDGGMWVESAAVTANDGEDLDTLGASVALDGDLMLAGAPSDDPDGSVYVFRRDGTVWLQLDRLTAAMRTALESDQFGSEMALGDAHLVVGARLDDTAGTNAGAAFVFRK